MSDDEPIDHLDMMRTAGIVCRAERGCRTPFNCAATFRCRQPATPAPAYEPPRLTLVGNLHQLLAEVCPCKDK